MKNSENMEERLSIADMTGSKQSNKNWSEWRIDRPVVLCVRTKDSITQGLFNAFPDTFVEDRPIERLDYSSEAGTKISVFSIDYMKKIINAIEESGDDFIELAIRNEYPVRISSENWQFILAPRVNEFKADWNYEKPKEQKPCTHNFEGNDPECTLCKKIFTYKEMYELGKEQATKTEVV